MTQYSITMARHMQVDTAKPIVMRYTQTLLIAIGLLCFMPVDALAERGKLKADCIIQIKGGLDGQTRLTVMPGTTPAYVLTPTDLHFVLDLVLDETYLLTFEHPGCVTKELYVDASVPLDKRSMDFDFPLKVLLEHHDEPFTYAGPVGFIFYEHGLKDFSYHTDYAININDRFAGRMAEFERTGVDPRSATLGYTASTQDPQTTTPEPVAPATFWNVQAPVVAHVAPMVHRLSRPDTSMRESDVSMLPVSTIDVPQLAIDPMALRVSEPVVVLQAVERSTETATIDYVVEASTNTIMATAPAYQDVSWELIVEERRVTTIIRLTDETERSTEYRRVLHGSGAKYFFQDGRSISEYTYDKGTAGVKRVSGGTEHEALEL
jgi:hypothetical protein